MFNTSLSGLAEAGQFFEGSKDGKSETSSCSSLGPDKKSASSSLSPSFNLTQDSELSPSPRLDSFKEFSTIDIRFQIAEINWLRREFVDFPAEISSLVDVTARSSSSSYKFGPSNQNSKFFSFENNTNLDYEIEF